MDLILAKLCEGDDHLTVAGNVDLPLFADGGGGNDHIKAGRGPAVLLGSAGDDELIGGLGRNLLIGGLGADRLVGGVGDDLLIAGTTSFDDQDADLLALLAEWNENLPHDDRVANLRAGTGSSGLRLAKGETVFDDADVDVLTGASGLDWFLDDLVNDVATDRKRESAN